MTTAALTDTDVRLRDAVRKQLDWDPAVDSSAIGVAAVGGSVTLTGQVDSYAAKLAAERVAQRVRGVRAVANDIEVRLRLERTDADIAQDAARALELRDSVPASVQAAVRYGHVNLTGRVSWLFQKHDAEAAVRHIRGVRNVSNHIVVTPHDTVRDVRRRIVTALHQNADVDARQIAVSVSGETVTLAGTVGTWLQRDSAEHAAANAPGISHVDNHIVVEPSSEPEVEPVDEIC